MSEDSNKKMSPFFKFNLALFLFYSILLGVKTGSATVIFSYIIVHINVLGVIYFFQSIFDNVTKQTLGYVILVLLFLAIVGFSVCAGSIHIH